MMLWTAMSNRACCFGVISVRPSAPCRPVVPLHGSFDVRVARGRKLLQHVSEFVHPCQFGRGKIFAFPYQANQVGDIGAREFALLFHRCRVRRIAVTNLAPNRARTMTLPHLLNLIWEVAYLTAILVGMAFIARDWLQRRARRRAAIEGLHAANDNQRGRRRQHQ